MFEIFERLLYIYDNNFGIGTCYQMTQDLKYDQDLGQGNIISPCKGYSTRNEHMEYAFCQGGTSAYISDVSNVGEPVTIFLMYD